MFCVDLELKTDKNVAQYCCNLSIIAGVIELQIKVVIPLDKKREPQFRIATPLNQFFLVVPPNLINISWK